MTVTIEGEGADRLARDGTNVVARGVKLAYEAAGRDPSRAARSSALTAFPPRAGSARARRRGWEVWSRATRSSGRPLSRHALLGLAARAEGHPDNVAAAILGGLTVSCGTPEGVTAVTLPVTKSLTWVVLVPEVTSATAEARALLPRSVPREDAVFNVQRVALLLAGLQTSLPQALSVALDDRLHQPYRLKLFPWMPDIATAARAAGALGCVLSGAGPSLLAVVAGDGHAVGSAMEAALSRNAGVRGKAREFSTSTPSGASSTVS